MANGLQERIDELGSGVINIVRDKAHVLGFVREDMLNAYLDRGSKCWSLMGLHDFDEEQKIDFLNTKNNALIILQKDGEEISRHQYEVEHKDVIEYINKENKQATKTIAIRKDRYSNKYHLYAEDISRPFNNRSELSNYLLKTYKYSY